MSKSSLADSHPLFDGAVLTRHFAAPLKAAVALFCFSHPNQIIAATAAHGGALVIACAVLAALDVAPDKTHGT